MTYQVLLNRTISAQRRRSHRPWSLTPSVKKLGGYADTRPILRRKSVVGPLRVTLRCRKQSVVVVVDVVERADCVGDC